MKKFSVIILFLLLILLISTGCSSNKTSENVDNQGVTINVSAAASLSEALIEIQGEYANESNDILQFNFAGSGSLQKQIQEGAPCDLFISASEPHMDTLEEAGFVDSDSRKDMLANTLTLIVAQEKVDIITGIDSLTSAEAEWISIGEPETVPAGQYAQQAFDSLGISNEIEDKIIFAKDVKQVLDYVDTGNVDAGLVYKSDAILLETGVIIEDMPTDSHDPIVYPAALIKDGDQVEAAADFYEFLQTDYAKEVFGKYGFDVL